MSLFDHIHPDDYSLPTSLTEKLLSPALIVWMPAVRQNIAKVITLCGSADRWRPHVKTTKIPAVWRELMDAGVRRFKTSTTRETALLCATLDDHGIAGDVLMAQPLVGPAMRRLDQIAVAHPQQRLSVLIEDPERLADVPASLHVFVDVNSGMDRTGVPLAHRAEISTLCHGAGKRLAGLHFYDGHLHQGDLTQREASIHKGYNQLISLLDTLATDEGCPIAEVITAGTPAFAHALSHDGLANLSASRHTVSPGTVVFHDARSEAENPGLGLAPAATVFSRVISHPATGRVTCDAGHKAVSADMGDPCARVLGRPELVANSPSEEHLPLRVTLGESPPRGTQIQLIPEHVCPTVNLAEEAVLMEADGRWTVASVAGRAHELLLDGDLRTS
ncbi:MAG: D-serine deaminase-like pyridoxal phosphate-dependent protein [Pseudohongiellaceae bacterium]|jgi:D-serine deaminase-like pyridoxal phosphate-dependent protein